MNCEYNDQIIDYIDNALNREDRKKFEEYLNNNKEFRDIVEDFKFQTKLVSELPHYETSPNFIVSLNEKIDKYESGRKNIFSNLFTSKNINYAPVFGVFSLFIVISFSIFKISNYNTNFSSSDNNIDNSMAVNDVDSLKSDYDDVPILLIGNEK